MDEEISSDSESESLPPRRTEEEEEEEQEETAQEKKLRLAKLYLEQLRQQEEEKAEARAFEEDQVAGRLKEDVLEQRGRLQKSMAKEIQAPAPADIRVLRGHQLSITCVVITPDDAAIFSAAKDCSIIKWSVESGRKLHVIPRAKKGAEGQPPGHSSPILCMAISSDGKYLASGDRGKLILVWEAQSCGYLYTFTGHRDAVSVGAVDACQATKWAGLGRRGERGRGPPSSGSLRSGAGRGAVKDTRGWRDRGELGGSELTRLQLLRRERMSGGPPWASRLSRLP